MATYDEDAVSTNPTFEAEFQVWLQVGMHASLITATVLVLRPIIYNMNTNYGALGPMISNGYGAESKNSYAMSNLSGAQRSRSENPRLEPSVTEPHTVSNVAPATCSASSRPQGSVETGSVESGNSQRMIIKKTTSWRIETL